MPLACAPRAVPLRSHTRPLPACPRRPKTFSCGANARLARQHGRQVDDAGIGSGQIRYWSNPTDQSTDKYLRRSRRYKAPSKLSAGVLPEYFFNVISSTHPAQSSKQSPSLDTCMPKRNAIYPPSVALQATAFGFEKKVTGSSQ
jgi:hypothetical protein